MNTNDKRVRAWNNQGVPLERCVAYCKYHKYYLTYKQMKRKGCLQKQCRLLKRLNCPYWEERRKRKNAKKC